MTGSDSPCAIPGVVNRDSKKDMVQADDGDAAPTGRVKSTDGCHVLSLAVPTSPIYIPTVPDKVAPKSPLKMLSDCITPSPPKRPAFSALKADDAGTERLTPSSSRMRATMISVSDGARKLKSRLGFAKRTATKDSDLLGFGGDTAKDGAEERDARAVRCLKIPLPSWLYFPETIDPNSTLYLSWLVVVMLAFVYNAIVIPMRLCYFNETWVYGPYVLYMSFDYFCDLIYFLDIWVFKRRLKFVKGGLLVEDVQVVKKHYVETLNFRLDVLSLTPLDILYLIPGSWAPSRAEPSSLFRVFRLCKLMTYFEFVEKCEQTLSNPHVFRTVRSGMYLLYLIHVNSCLYYLISYFEQYGVHVLEDGTTWVEPQQWAYRQGSGNAYIRSFYWALKTVTAIGNSEMPASKVELIFSLMNYLVGVFIFAIVIGQFRDVLDAASANKDKFRQKMNETMLYMQMRNIPSSVQKRVRLWYDYLWQTQEMLDERDALEALPIKMRTDVAMAVHIETLRKVSMFQECDQMLLRDLVLRLKPVLYLPGDYVCRKGEVGKEMYIVNHGIVQVVGGETGTDVFATLQPGSVFGEIALLSVGLGNRRTADVMSPGFANLFVLLKEDLNEVIEEYADAKLALKKRAQEIVIENQKKAAAAKAAHTAKLKANVLKKPKKKSKLLDTVLSAKAEVDGLSFAAAAQLRIADDPPVVPKELDGDGLNETSIVQIQVNSDSQDGDQHLGLNDARNDSTIVRVSHLDNGEVHDGGDLAVGDVVEALDDSVAGVDYLSTGQDHARARSVSICSHDSEFDFEVRRITEAADSDESIEDEDLDDDISRSEDHVVASDIAAIPGSGRDHRKSDSSTRRRAPRSCSRISEDSVMADLRMDSIEGPSSDSRQLRRASSTLMLGLSFDQPFDFDPTAQFPDGPP